VSAGAAGGGVRVGIRPISGNRPLVRGLEWPADLVRSAQSGDVNLYLLYVFAVILLAYLLGAV
jgi:hypothetical protein